MTLSQFRSKLYRSARLLGDVNALRRGTILARAVRRIAGKLAARALRRI